MPTKKKIIKKVVKKTTKKAVKKTVKKTQKNLVSYILDMSGSMEGQTVQVISGYREYVETLRKTMPDDTLSLTLFNGRGIKTSSNLIKDAPFLDTTTYRPDSVTPLYDAIGKTLVSLDAYPNDKIMVVIMTDGMENASNEYTLDKISSMIEERKKKGWAFLFMGANMDSFGVANALNVSRGSTMNYSPRATGQTISNTATVVATYYAGNTTADNLIPETQDGV